MMQLHNYFRSSASFRVRIALNLKGLPYDCEAVQIARGEHLGVPFSTISPDRLVPGLEDDGEHFSQSMAVFEACMQLNAFSREQSSSSPDAAG